MSILGSMFLDQFSLYLLFLADSGYFELISDVSIFMYIYDSIFHIYLLFCSHNYSLF